ncbi:MAG: relaxase MobL [Oscillospiraceae bacterium]|nr:relaxase MobL [Oscillospiraceae bacterium]
MRSVLANDIFQDELQSIYQEQTVSRDDLKKLSEEEFNEILKQIQDSKIHRPELEQLVKKLYIQLRKTKGKKVYGYLPKEIKQTVNEIFAELAMDDKINLLYEKWCQLEKLKYKSYTIQEPELRSLTENKTFHSIRNMIIKNILKMDSFIMLGQWDNLEIEKDLTDDIYYQLDWSEDYRKAHEMLKKLNASEQEKKKSLGLLINEAKNRNILALLDLGKIYDSDFLGEEDTEKSYQCYAKALNELIILEPKAKKIRASLQYQIGKMFCYGIGTEKNPEKALEYLTLSEQTGNLYAKRLLGRELLSGENILKDTESGIRILSECVKSNDLSSVYLLAKFLLKDTAYRNPVKAMELLKKSAEQNVWASFLIGKLYLFGIDETEPDRESAVLWLTKSAESGNAYAQELLNSMEQFQNQVLADTSFRLFVGLSRIIDEDYHQEQKKMGSHVDSKLKWIIQKKKQEIGIRESLDHTQNY